MMLYKIALFLFIFGAVVTGINDSGLFSATLPENNIVQYDQATVQDLTESASGEVNPLFTIAFIQLAIKSILSGVLAIATIIPMMLAFGFPGWIALMIQGPIWFVMAVGVYEFITGNNVEA